jgi:gamma-glutamyltranspeptidase
MASPPGQRDDRGHDRSGHAIKRLEHCARAGGNVWKRHDSCAIGMDCQQAVEAPRFATYSHPNSFEPHGYEPGVLRVESTVPADVRKELEDLGHTVIVWPPYDWRAGGIAVIAVDEDGMRSAGADPRRENYALAW